MIHFIQKTCLFFFFILLVVPSLVLQNTLVKSKYTCLLCVSEETLPSFSSDLTSIRKLGLS